MTDYADDLSAAFDEAEQPELEVTETPELSETPEIEAELPEAAPEVTEEPELPPIDYPSAWKKDYNESWGGLPRNVQEYINEREKQAMQGINERSQQLKELESQYNPLKEILEPYQQTFAMQGMTPVQGIQQLMAYQQALTTNPQETLLQLAQAYGVDLQQAFEEQPYIDPHTQKLEQTVQQLQQQMSQSAQQQQVHQQQAIVEQIEQFAGATDETGELKHPHFETVFDDMIMLYEMGRVSSLDQAYSEAVRFNPDIQAQLNEQREAEVKAQKAAQAKAARDAARTVDSKTTAAPTTGGKSFEDDLAAEFEAMGL